MNPQGETISEFQRKPYLSAAVDKTNAPWIPIGFSGRYWQCSYPLAYWSLVERQMGEMNLDFRAVARVGVKLTVLVGKSLVDLDFRCRDVYHDILL